MRAPKGRYSRVPRVGSSKLSRGFSRNSGEQEADSAEKEGELMQRLIEREEDEGKRSSGRGGKKANLV